MNASYYQKDKPNSLFNSFAPFWHLWTPENHEIIFPDEKSFCAGMGLVGICAKLSRDVQVVTFELMSNHVHFVLSGTEEAAKEFFQMFREHLSRFFKRQSSARNLKDFDCSLRQAETLDDLRNVIAYTNRNGFLVNPAETPFNYPWGANGYYFNRHAKMRFRESTKTMTFKERRDLAQSRQAESVNEGLTMVDGCLCPLTYCNIELWEGLFWDAHQYVSRVFKNIEAQKKIAEEVGESIFYTDDELFAAVCLIAKDQYGIPFPTQLPSQAKVAVAKIMKTGYKASNKQIQRMLKMDSEAVNRLFPQ